MQAHTLRRLPLVAVVSLLSLAAFRPATPLYYLAPDAVAIPALLPPPPALGSPSDMHDRDILLMVQSSRTQAQVDVALKENSGFDVFDFADVIGPWFTAANCPKTAALFKKIDKDAKFFSGAGKVLWNRKRPYWVDDRIHTPAPKETEPSYPSGHATRALVYAEVLATLFPGKEEALLERARESAWNRIILGVHFPSDIAAGQVLGHNLAPKFAASPAFATDLAAVKQELAAAAPAQK
jgi:membrane-associated phospholipid phosphatase